MTNFTILGHVDEKPIMETAKNGNHFIRLKIRVPKATGSNDCDIYETIAWNALAEDDYEKDRLVCINGRLMANNFERDANTYYNTRLVAEKIDFYS